MGDMEDVYKEVNRLLPDPKTAETPITPYNIQKAFVLLRENSDRVKNYPKRKNLKRFFLTQLTPDSVRDMADFSEGLDAIGQFARNNTQKVVNGKDVTFGDLWEKYPWNQTDEIYDKGLEVYDWVDYANGVFGGTETTHSVGSTTPDSTPTPDSDPESDQDILRHAEEYNRKRSQDMATQVNNIGIGGTPSRFNRDKVREGAEPEDITVITSDDEEDEAARSDPDVITLTTSDDEEDETVQSDDDDKKYFPLLRAENVPSIGKGSIDANRNGTFLYRLKQFASKVMRDTNKEILFDFQECRIDTNNMVVLPESAEELSADKFPKGLKALKMPSPDSSTQDFTWIIIGYQPAKDGSKTMINFVAWVENFEYDDDLHEYVDYLRSGVSLLAVLEEAKRRGVDKEYLLEKGFTSEDGSQGANLFQFNIFAYEFDVSDSLVNYLRAKLGDILQGVNPDFDLVDDDTQYLPNKAESAEESRTAKYINRVYFSFIKFVIEDAGITEYEFLSGSDYEDDREASEKEGDVAEVPESLVELKDYQDKKREASARKFRKFASERQGANFLTQVLQLDMAEEPNVDSVPVDVPDGKGNYKIEFQPLDARKRLETQLELNKKLLQNAETKLMRNVQFVLTVVTVLQKGFPGKSLKEVIEDGARLVGEDTSKEDLNDLFKDQLKTISIIMNDHKDIGVDVDLEETIETQLKETPDALEELVVKLFENCDDYTARKNRINELNKSIELDNKKLGLATEVGPAGNGKRGSANQGGVQKRVKPKLVSETKLFPEAGPAGNNKRKLAAGKPGVDLSPKRRKWASALKQKLKQATDSGDSGEDGSVKWTSKSNSESSDSESGDESVPEVDMGRSTRPAGNSVNVDFTSTLVGLERLHL